MDTNPLSDASVNMFFHSMGCLFILLMVKHPSVYCSIIYNHQDMEAAQVSINRWTGKTTMGHLHNGMLLSHKKRKKNAFYDSMVYLENIMLSE